MATEVKIPDSFGQTIRLLCQCADLYRSLLSHTSSILDTHSQAMVYIHLGMVVDKEKIESRALTFKYIHDILTDISVRIQLLFNNITQLHARILST